MEYIDSGLGVLSIGLNILLFKNLLDTYENRIKNNKEIIISTLKLITAYIVLVNILKYLVLNRIDKLSYLAITIDLNNIIIIPIVMFFCKKNYNLKLLKSFIFILIYKNIFVLLRQTIYWTNVFIAILIGYGGENYPTKLAYTLDNFLFCVILLLLNIVLNKYRKKLRYKKYIISILMIIFLIVPMYMYIFMSKHIDFYQVKFKNSNYNEIWSLIGVVAYKNTIPSLIIVIILLVFTIIKVKESISIEKEKIIIEEKVKAQCSYYEKLKETQERTRHLYHDMKNHLICMNSINESKNSKKYRESIEKELEKIDCLYDTKNDILNIILKEKKDVCINNDIDFFVDINFEKCQFISIIDVCSIFSNILDNAIEASLKVKDNNRYIKIRGNIVKNYFVLKCKNSKVNLLKRNGNKIISGKKDKYLHGIGLKSVESSLKKYNGEFIFYDYDYEFEINIYIPIEN